jgi:hypothetical protein
MAESGRDRRVHERFGVDGHGITCTVQRETRADLLNISPGGASIRIGRPLAEGTEYAIRFAAGSHAMTILGTVAWSECVGIDQTGDSKRPVYACGIRFNRVLSGLSEGLLSFIQAHATEGSEDPCFMPSSGLTARVVQDPASAVAARPPKPEVDVRVRRIGMRGMLVESDSAMRTGSRFSMELALPSPYASGAETAGGRAPLELIGLIAACEPIAGHEGLYEVLVEYITMPPEDARRLEAFVQSLGSGNQTR